MTQSIKKNELRTEIVLNASKNKVWSTLVDIEAWSAWNPFIVHASGIVKRGSTLTNTFMNKGKPMVFKPTVTDVDPNKKFAWLGSALLGGFKGSHYFILEDTNDGKTTLIHGEIFSGWLVWLILPMLRKQTLKGFIGMNRALKSRVENQ